MDGNDHFLRGKEVDGTSFKLFAWSVDVPLKSFAIPLHGDFLPKVSLVAFWKRSSYPITIKITSKKMEEGLATALMWPFLTIISNVIIC